MKPQVISKSDSVIVGFTQSPGNPFNTFTWMAARSFMLDPDGKRNEFLFPLTEDVHLDLMALLHKAARVRVTVELIEE